MPTSTSEPAAAGLAIADALRRRARDLGFDAIGFARADAVPDVSERLQRFITLGRHGDMDWLAAKADRRRAPHALWPEVRSVIMLGMNYGPAGDPLTLLRRTDRGNISVYARGRDYHDVIKGRLKQLARWLGETHDAGVKVFVDTAPVAEKPLAEAAGLGWQGKHTNLVHREFGSWLFLGAIFTDLALPADAAHDDHCGDCRRCLDVCPTQAFPAPYQLDARRCISYLTIEHKGHIAAEFRAAMGNRIFGCDDCLAVCPWNKFAQLARETTLMPRAELTAPRLADLMRLTDADFRAVFAGTPVKRLGRDRFVRNVLIAAGNSGEAALLPQVEALLGDASPLVRAMAVWALRRLADAPRIRRLRTQRLAEETDADVLQEWHAADVVAAAPV